MNSGAVKRPELISELAAALGRQCVVLAIDARKSATKGAYDVLIKGGREVFPLPFTPEALWDARLPLTRDRASLSGR